MTYGRKSQSLFCSLSVLETPELWSPSPPVCKLTKPPLMRLYDTVYVHRPLFGKFAALYLQHYICSINYTAAAAVCYPPVFAICYMIRA